LAFQADGVMAERWSALERQPSAGGGLKRGYSYGESDDFASNPAKDPVNVHDFQAPVLHLLGIDHERLAYKFQGRYFRLTDVHGRVVSEILA
jgi:uncharacterized protein DUF1501